MAMYVKFETPKDVAEKTYQIVEAARDSGKLRKGTNEVTKFIERKDAAFVVMAEDVEPQEILAHLPMLCEEKGIPYGYVPSKAELGVATGLKKPTASAAIVDAGKGKDALKTLVTQLGGLKKGDK
jgi:large subunit ribosomal protein L7Ae